MSYARRFPLTAYFFLACLIGWYPFAATFLTGGSGAENFPLGPGIAAFVVLACLGREELRAWGRRLRDWRAPVRWYAVALLVPIALQLLIVLVNHGLGAPLPTSEQLADWPQVPVTFVAMLILVGIGEEIGWTAFAAPRLLERHGFLTAFVLAASIRILWHLPMMLSGDLLGPRNRGQHRIHHGHVARAHPERRSLVPGRGLAREPQRRRWPLLLHDGHRCRQGATGPPAERLVRGARHRLVHRRQPTPPCC
jgi:membrane protease YdiL (CAAX protease family)